MVALNIIQASNQRIKSTLPPGLVAIFVGATNGVGETTVRQFAKHAAQPRVYIIGRSQEAGERIAAECRGLNPAGTFIFLQRETSLMRKVDELCKELASKEPVINLLFLSVGTLQIGMSESICFSVCLFVCSHRATIYILSSFSPPPLPLKPSLRMICTKPQS